MSLPNIITLARIFSVPVVIWLIVSGQFMLAFIAFIAAGISDGVDGFLAKRFDMATELGAYLDPLADKLLLVSIYLALGVQHYLPAWLVILVASRDVIIVGGVLLAWLIDQPLRMHPLIISKINTTGQILLAGTVLGVLGFEYPATELIRWGGFAVALLTVASGAAYVRDWIRHMSSAVAS